MFANSGFYSLVALAIVHLFANRAKVFGWIWHGRFLSFAAGISFAYVFVDLLPSLEEKQPVLKATFDPIVPYLSKHAYFIALLGVLFYYGIHTKENQGTLKSYWISLSGYLLFNFLVGASLTDIQNPDIQPLALFTFAMGMHYFVRDHLAKMANNKLFEKKTRWLLVLALFAGYLLADIIRIPDVFVAIAVSFVSGGMLLNALHYELPKREQVGYLFFVLGALLYTAILLGLGEP